MATASSSRRGLQTAMSSDAGASSAVPPTPSPPTPKPRPPAPSTSPPVGVKHQDGEKLSSMEKRKFPTVKWAKAPEAKRFRSSMTPIPVKSPGVRFMLPMLMGASKKRKRSSLTHTVTVSTSMSTVLDNDDILEEVLLRLALPTSLVRAALVCRRWLCIASTPAFLERFYGLHPSHTLGFYVQSSHLRLPKFTPMPGLPPELANSVRSASSALDAYTPTTSRAYIMCCLNSHLLVRLDGPDGRRNAVLSPLHPARDAVILPPLPSAIFQDNVTWLEKTDLLNDGVTVYAAGKHAGKLLKYELRDGAWHNVTSVPENELPGKPAPCCFLPIKDNKILISSVSYTKGRWASSETPHLMSVALPDGVEYIQRHKSNFATWADSSVVYLFYVDIKALQLRVWLYRMDSQNWSREDTICMRTVFTDSGVTSLVSQDGNKVVILSVGPRRSAMCVLLQVGTDVLYIDIKSRTAKKVYTITPEDGVLFRLINFSMIFPPVFPLSKDDNDQNTIRSSEVSI